MNLEKMFHIIRGIFLIFGIFLLLEIMAWLNQTFNVQLSIYVWIGIIYFSFVVAIFLYFYNLEAKNKVRSEYEKCCH